MTVKRLLITGAAGSTGRNAVETLVRQGCAVRALVHGEDERLPFGDGRHAPIAAEDQAQALAAARTNLS